MEDNGIEFSFRKEKEPVLLIISIGTTRWGRGCFGAPLSEEDIVKFLQIKNSPDVVFQGSAHLL